MIVDVGRNCVSRFLRLKKREIKGEGRRGRILWVAPLGEIYQSDHQISGKLNLLRSSS